MGDLKPPPAPDAAARQRAWQVLSNLFLDTELDDAAIEAMARDLRATGFTPAELQHLYEHEVAPVCWRNLLVLPGGEWAGFDEASLAQAIQQHLARASRLPAWWRRARVRCHTAMTRADWQRLAARLAADPAPPA
jgi:hypothetical protein